MAPRTRFLTVPFPVAHPAMILSPSGLSGVLVQIARGNVVVLA
jgi:hypothetical protein